MRVLLNEKAPYAFLFQMRALDTKQRINLTWPISGANVFVDR